MKINSIKIAFVITFAFLLSSCSAPDVEHYKSTTPNFDFKEFFNGKLKAYGVVQDFTGEVTRKLVVDMNAHWEANKGVIEEDFIYDDGEKQKRIWYITINEDNSIIGTADDVEGEATGKSRGSVFHWQYTVEIEYDDSMVKVDFDDWMYLVSKTRLINRTSIDKFGFPVGEVTLSIEKIE
jgi:hypothetical protein